VDGGQHDQPEKRRYDETRTRWLEGAGFRVIRFWDVEVLKEVEGVISRIRAEQSRKKEL